MENEARDGACGQDRWDIRGSERHAAAEKQVEDAAERPDVGPARL